MNDQQRAERLEYLRKCQNELDNLSDEDFPKIVENKYGAEIANMCKSFGFAGAARQLLTNRFQKEIAELSE